MIGYCKYRKDFRDFKLLRIKNLKTGSKYKKKEISEEKISKYFKEEFLENSIHVLLKFTKKSGGRLSEYFKKETIIEKKDGYYVEEYFPDDDGLIKAILSFGKECEVIKPLELRIKFKKYLEDIYSKYNG